MSVRDYRVHHVEGLVIQPQAVGGLPPGPDGQVVPATDRPGVPLMVRSGGALVSAGVLTGGEASVQMFAAGNVGAGGVTVAVGCEVMNGGDPLGRCVVEFGVFDDPQLASPAKNARLSGALDGTILGGEGTAVLKVETDEDGVFRCTLTDYLDETVYLGCAPSFGSRALACESIDTVTFST